AARRPDQDHELVIVDLEVDALDYRDGPEPLRHLLERDRSHRSTPGNTEQYGWGNHIVLSKRQGSRPLVQSGIAPLVSLRLGAPESAGNTSLPRRAPPYAPA